MADRLHVCQDDFGYWFITREWPNGRLEVIHHADRHDAALSDAERIAERDSLDWIAEDPQPGVEFQEEGYQPPEPRKARGA